MQWKHCGRCITDTDCTECPCSPSYEEWKESKEEGGICGE
jgi:hypothetical protein